MLVYILLLTLLPFLVLILGFVGIKLPFISQHPEMHFYTFIKEQIFNFFHIHTEDTKHHNTGSLEKITNT
ncbi:MAG: hypothetical protein WKF35_05705 [Ferruginibacter sp.]